MAEMSTTTASALNSRTATASNAPVEKAPEEGSKFKTLLGILRKFVFRHRETQHTG
jgi:hypothetical protein